MAMFHCLAAMLVHQRVPTNHPPLFLGGFSISYTIQLYGNPNMCDLDSSIVKTSHMSAAWWYEATPLKAAGVLAREVNP